jgi:S-adenosylmethionine hydrolase
MLGVEVDASPMPPATRPIVFASDFGLGNEWVGICHSVLAALSPQSPIVDLTHLIRPLEVLSGALLLADSMPYIAEDAVVLGVVDPNVGKDREVAIGTSSGRYLVGPDNGLLSLAWEAAGGIAAVVEISSPDVVHPPRAESFRAPDTLCPAAAHLALGRPLEELGEPVEARTLNALTLAESTGSATSSSTSGSRISLAPDWRTSAPSRSRRPPRPPRRGGARPTPTSKRGSTA